MSMLVFSLSTSKTTWRWSSADSSWKAQNFFQPAPILTDLGLMINRLWSGHGFHCRIIEWWWRRLVKEENC